MTKHRIRRRSSALRFHGLKGSRVVLAALRRLSSASAGPWAEAMGATRGVGDGE